MTLVPVYLSLLLVLCTYNSLGDESFGLLQGSRSKFMFQHSFKPPLIVNNKGHVPFWEHGGDAIPTADQIRVCPSIQDRRGWLWNTYQFEGTSWTFDASFSITGRNTYGADGMAFWYTSSKGNGGEMFGNTPSYTGLGVVIDTFDNDAKGDSPKVAVFLSNGSLQFNHGIDGSNQELKSCTKQVRNLKFPLKMKVMYYKNTLEVWMTDGSNNNSISNYELCVRSTDIYLPSTGHFGVSAATGGLSDDHDVMSFVVHKLTPSDQYSDKVMESLDKAHADRLNEYEKFSQDFETKVGHKTPPTGENEDWQVRLKLEENVRLLYDMQGSIIRDVKMLHNKVDQIVNMKLTGGGTGGGGMSEEKVLAMEGRLNHHLQELKSNLAGGDGGKVTASQQLQPIYEMKEHVVALQQTINRIQAEIQVLRSSPCPQVSSGGGSSSCLSSWLFILVILVQSAVVIGILFAKYSQERNAKKFF